MFLLVVVVIATYLAYPSQHCKCRKALGDDIAHGANEVIEYDERTVKSIRGKIVYLDDKPAEDVVVEIHELTERNKNLPLSHIASQPQRLAACVTGVDGTFCFPQLPSGKYLLRAGTRSSAGGMNEVYIRVALDKRWWTSWLRSGKPIELTLTPGT